MLGTNADTLTGRTASEVFALLRSSLQDPQAVWESVNADITERPRYEAVFEGPPQRDLLVQRFSIGGSGAMGILLHDQTTERELV
jgi:hypothetical protein